MSPTADERIEEQTQHVDHGFWNPVNELVFSAITERTMSRTCDRFNEARHFIQLIRRSAPSPRRHKGNHAMLSVR